MRKVIAWDILSVGLLNTLTRSSNGHACYRTAHDAKSNCFFPCPSGERSNNLGIDRFQRDKPCTQPPTPPGENLWHGYLLTKQPT